MENLEELEELEELIKKAQNQKGNPKEAEKAFTKLVQKYQNNLYRIAIVLTHNIEDTEDLVQATIGKAFCKIHQVESAKTFKRWIETILINKWKKQKKKRKRIKEVPLEYYDESKINSSREIQELESELDFNILIETNEEAEIDDKIILILYYKEGFKLKELSEMLEMNYESLKTRIRRIRGEYRELLEGNAHG